MVLRGAFADLEPMKVELIYGKLRFKNPAGPVHEGEIQFLMEWSILHDKSATISPLCRPAATLSLAELFDLDS